MTNINPADNGKPLEDALATIKLHVQTLGELLRDTTDPEQRAKLEEELASITTGIGLELVPGTTPSAETGATGGEERRSAGSVLLSNVQKIVDSTADKVGTVTTAGSSSASVGETETEVKISIWKRFTSYCGNHKRTLLGLVFGALAIGASVFYLMKAKNSSATVSSVHGMTDTTGVSEMTAEATVTDPAPTVTTSVFDRAGTFFVKAGAAVKQYAASAWGWIKSVFNKITKKEATVESPTETVPAAA